MSCTFATVFEKLYEGQKEIHKQRKREFLCDLLTDADYKGEISGFDKSMHSRFISGAERLPTRVGEYYDLTRQSNNLELTLTNKIFPRLQEISTTVQEIQSTVETDPFMSSSKKCELLSLVEDNATFVAEVLRYVMVIPLKQLAKNEALDFLNVILGHKPPEPCAEFCGRERELQDLHGTLITQKRAFLTGVAGLGKSEIIAAYASEYAKNYANIIWLPCGASLHESIEKLRVKGNPYGTSPEDAFQYRDQLLRALPENALLILDGVNWPIYDDSVLQDIVSEYRCHIAITTRCPVDDYPAVEIGPISSDKDRFHLMETHFTDANTHKTAISRIMAALDNHTMAIVLAAKLLQSCLLTPAQLLTKIYAHNLLENLKDAILHRKDNVQKKRSYSNHIKLLFRLSELSEAEKQVLCGLTVMPAEGINEKTFGTLMLMNSLNDVHRLIDLGYVSKRDDRILTLFPLIRETVETEIGVTFTQIASLYDSLKRILLTQWHWKLPDPSLVEAIIDNLSDLTCSDCRQANRSMYHDAYGYFAKYGLFSAQSGILARLRQEVAQNPSVSDRDRALVLLYEAGLLRDAMPEKAVELLEAANSLITDGSDDIAVLKANILGSLGVLYHCAGQVECAKYSFETAISLYNLFSLGFGEDYVTLMTNYCVFLASDGCDKDSLSTLLELHKEVRAIDAESPLLTTIERTLGGILLAIEDTVEASKWLHSAYQRQCMQGGEDSPLAQEIRQAIEHYKLF